MASEYALIGSNCEAYGHPNECQEPASGSVTESSESSVTIDGVGIATIKTADMHFNSHAHAYDPENGCISMASHDIDPDEPGPGTDSSVRINGSPVYVANTSVATDPDSGGAVDIIDSGGNSSVSHKS